MMDTLKLYFRYVGISLRGQMQHRTSFILLAIGQFMVTCVEFLAIWAMFDRFKMLGDWSLEEVGLFYGIIHVGFAFAEGFGRGFDVFSGMVRSGDFDRILLRPRSTVLQIAASEVQLMRIGRLIQGLIILIWASLALNIGWTIASFGLLLFAIFGSASLFIGLFVIQGTWSFWTIESLELMNTVTYGGTETGQYPLSIYKPWLRKFFTFVVPLASVTYFPAIAILGKQDMAMGSPGWFGWVAPATGVLFLALSLQFWKFGVRHYRSTGS